MKKIKILLFSLVVSALINNVSYGMENEKFNLHDSNESKNKSMELFNLGKTEEGDEENKKLKTDDCNEYIQKNEKNKDSIEDASLLIGKKRKCENGSNKKRNEYEQNKKIFKVKKYKDIYNIKSNKNLIERKEQKNEKDNVDRLIVSENKKRQRDEILLKLEKPTLDLLEKLNFLGKDNLVKLLEEIINNIEKTEKDKDLLERKEQKNEKSDLGSSNLLETTKEWLMCLGKDKLMKILEKIKKDNEKIDNKIENNYTEEIEKNKNNYNIKLNKDLIERKEQKNEKSDLGSSNLLEATKEWLMCLGKDKLMKILEKIKKYNEKIDNKIENNYTEEIEKNKDIYNIKLNKDLIERKEQKNEKDNVDRLIVSENKKQEGNYDLLKLLKQPLNFLNKDKLIKLLEEIGSNIEKIENNAKKIEKNNKKNENKNLGRLNVVENKNRVIEDISFESVRQLLNFLNKDSLKELSAEIKNNIEKIEKDIYDSKNEVLIEIAKIKEVSKDDEDYIKRKFRPMRLQTIYKMRSLFKDFIVDCIWNRYEKTLEARCIDKEDLYVSQQINQINDWFLKIDFDEDLIFKADFDRFYDNELLKGFKGKEDMILKMRGLLLDSINETIGLALEKANLPEYIILFGSYEPNLYNNQIIKIPIRKYLANLKIKINDHEKIESNYPFYFEIIETSPVLDEELVRKSYCKLPEKERSRLETLGKTENVLKQIVKILCYRERRLINIQRKQIDGRLKDHYFKKYKEYICRFMSVSSSYFVDEVVNTMKKNIGDHVEKVTKEIDFSKLFPTIEFVSSDKGIRYNTTNGANVIEIPFSLIYCEKGYTYVISIIKDIYTQVIANTFKDRLNIWWQPTILNIWWEPML